MPLFQSESNCETILIKMTFDLHENETACRTHFHMKGFALLKQRYKRTRKWPIVVFLESRVFSSLAKLLQNRTPLNHQITLYCYGNIVFPDQAEYSYGKRKCFAAFSLRTN